MKVQVSKSEHFHVDKNTLLPSGCTMWRIMVMKISNKLERNAIKQARKKMPNSEQVLDS